MTNIACVPLNKEGLSASCCGDQMWSHPEVIALPGRALLRLESSRQPRRLFVTRGKVWITLERSPADIVLRPGESVDLPAKGLAIAEALADSTLKIVPGCRR